MLLGLVACTENEMVRSYGGSQKIKIPKDHVFINSTWKENNLWMLTKDTTTGKYYFSERSSYGILEGQIIFEDNKPLDKPENADTWLK